jgi:hypothetical protein
MCFPFKQKPKKLDKNKKKLEFLEYNIKKEELDDITKWKYKDFKNLKLIGTGLLGKVY